MFLACENTLVSDLSCSTKVLASLNRVLRDNYIGSCPVVEFGLNRQQQHTRLKLKVFAASNTVMP